MNRKEWDQTMPSILAGLAPGKYSLREIMLDSFSRYPQAHEAVSYTHLTLPTKA